MPGRIAWAACIEQEPDAPLGLVNPNFDEAGSRDVLVFFADARRRVASILLSSRKLGEHVIRLDVWGVIVRYPLAGDVADGPECGPPKLADLSGAKIFAGGPFTGAPQCQVSILIWEENCK
jgi:hypothetical protein